MNDPYDTRLCGSNTVVRIIYRSVGLKCFLFIYQNVRLLLSLYIQLYLNISQGSVEIHLQYGRIYNNHIISNCPQSVLVKTF